MNVLKPHKKLAVISALLEGCSVRATSRMTGVHKTTILKVLVEMGDKWSKQEHPSVGLNAFPGKLAIFF